MGSLIYYNEWDKPRIKPLKCTKCKNCTNNKDGWCSEYKKWLNIAITKCRIEVI